MQIENLITASKVYSEVHDRVMISGIVSGPDLNLIMDTKAKYDVSAAQAEVFCALIENKELETKLREAMVQVYIDALNALATEYLDEKMHSQADAALLLADQIE